MSEFQKGDRVRVNSSADALEAIWAPTDTNGMIGSVTIDDGIGVYVTFDDEFDGSNSWWFAHKMLEAI